jgi:formamidopyrimidine-DNA glycosylase
LTDDEIALLTRAVKASLRAGIARQGASLRDYATPNGARGRMQTAFNVYGRGGEPCERCGAPIDKIRVAGRGTWYCPSCQRLS